MAAVLELHCRPSPVPLTNKLFNKKEEEEENEKFERSERKRELKLEQNKIEPNKKYTHTYLSRILANHHQHTQPG
jgi:hypothetical protein